MSPKKARLPVLTQLAWLRFTPRYLLVISKPGSIVVASQDLYGATTNLLTTVFGAFGVKTLTADFSDLGWVAGKGEGLKTRSTSNGNDFKSLAQGLRYRSVREIAHSVGARLCLSMSHFTHLIFASH